MWRAALKNIWYRKTRFVLTTVAVVLGIAFLAGTMVLTDTIKKSFDDLFRQVGEGVDAQVRSAQKIKGPFGAEQRGPIPETLLAQVQAVPGVSAAEPTVAGTAIVIGANGKRVGMAQGAPALAYNWTEDRELTPMRLYRGRGPQSDNEVVINKAAVDQGKLVLGGEVTINTGAQGASQRYVLVGVSKFGDQDTPGGATITSFTTKEAQRLFNLQGQYSNIVVRADQGVSQSTLTKRIAEKLNDPSVQVITGEELIKESQDAIASGLSFFNTFLFAFVVVALVVGAFVIFNSIAITVAQRSQETALMRAIGASRAQVMWAVVLEAIVIGFVGSLIGIAIGLFIAQGLKAVFAGFGIKLPASGLVVQPSVFVQSVLVGILVTVVAALVPALRASRVPPIAAMRDVSVERPVHFVRRIAIAVGVVLVGVAALVWGLVAKPDDAWRPVLLGAGLVFVGVIVLGPVVARPVAEAFGAPLAALRGITGALARENATRNPRRTASTASALLIMVGLVGFITIVAASARASTSALIDQTIRADFVADSGEQFQGGFNPDIVERFRAVPGVDKVAPVRIGLFSYPGKDGEPQGAILLASDPASSDAVFDFQFSQGSFTSLTGNSMAVYKEDAASNGWKVGDVVPMTFTKTGVQDVRIGAIFDRRPGQFGSYLVSVAFYAQNFESNFDNQVYVKVAPGQAAKVRPELEKIVKSYGIGKLQDQAQFKQSQADQINQFLNLIYVMLLFAAIIAFFGIANTLALQIYERIREIGLLRAVGMNRGQLRATVRWEAVIISVLGSVLGLAVGVFFGWVLVSALKDEGFSAFELPVGQLAFVVVLFAVVAVVTAALPARRAARLDVLDAIAHE